MTVDDLKKKLEQLVALNPAILAYRVQSEGCDCTDFASDIEVSAAFDVDCDEMTPTLVVKRAPFRPESDE